MTWGNIISECNTGILQIQAFIEEDPANAAKYDYHLAVLQACKQAAIKQQNATIKFALAKVVQDFHEITGNDVHLQVNQEGWIV